MKIEPLENWGMPSTAEIEVAVASRKKPFIIAGPCSAETPEQLLETCRALAHTGINALRAGIWKPRTRPNSFEGVGEIGLQWFKEVRDELGIPIATEVATATHVELALKYGVDLLWIGARSTVNPFTVQEIADALRGVDIPVIVKNPLNPELALWIGALERVANAGITKLAAMHRGFSTFEKTKYRNQPMWQVAIELRSQMPELPLFFDPSHTGGKREYIYPLAQKALDLDYDGLMIEAHIDPDKAWSDAAQQVTPAMFAQILGQLKIREATSDNVEFQNAIEEMRSKIDAIDREIVELLAARMNIVEKLGVYKRENNVAAFQVDRWIKIFQSRPEWGQKMGLNKDFVGLVFKVIHDESIRIQTAKISD
ncbi:MAG: bifunctional 3-deoxy-7-phosphoheptulonate synthase/chorismate mutase type II [Cytophagales bacterium]|nr:bifunctional 3-deoxy-7-phosphoheptulonate synthase/chorismate mutase type II [Bernardetiaceae bacterium]MDW8210252.1 bifunctional 3-deoxy-7-phosphoheptulonate synthase/chorismate mutase type II [Cytophagales bacterium]